jgi:hypothetical protein
VNWTPTAEDKAVRAIVRLDKKLTKSVKLARSAGRRGNVGLMLEHFREAVISEQKMEDIFRDSPYRADEAHVIPEFTNQAHGAIEVLTVDLGNELEAT